MTPSDASLTVPPATPGPEPASRKGPKWSGPGWPRCPDFRGGGRAPNQPCGPAGRAASRLGRGRLSGKGSGRCRDGSEGARDAVPRGGADGGARARADRGGGDDEGPRPHPANASDSAACAVVAGGGGEGADDDGRDTRPSASVVGAGESASNGDEGKDEICSICLDMYDSPVQLPCGHSYCSACLDGWHIKSRFDVPSAQELSGLPSQGEAIARDHIQARHVHCYNSCRPRSGRPTV